MNFSRQRASLKVSVPLRGFCFSTVPPKNLVIPSLSRPFAERRLKFLFQGAADGAERASALVRQGAERMRLSFRMETVIVLIRCLGADSFFVADFATKKPARPTSDRLYPHGGGTEI